MKRLAKFIVVPFRLVRGRPIQLQMRQASTEEGAVRLAETMSERVDGVVAYEVIVDEETGDMNDPRVLAVFGRAPALDDAVAA